MSAGLKNAKSDLLLRSILHKYSKYVLEGAEAQMQSASESIETLVNQLPLWEQRANDGGQYADEYRALVDEIKSSNIIEKAMDKVSNTLETTDTEHALSQKICAESIRKSREAIDNTLKLTEAAMDAKKAMEFAATVWKKDALDFMLQSDELLNKFRQTRMALDFEVKHINSSMKDILSILGSPGFTEQMAAVHNLITAAEHLKALKDSGFLDAMMDTLIKAHELAQHTAKQSS